MPADTINCPICQQPMQKQNVPQGVEIDFCEAHGVWLDAGELEVIVKADAQHAQAAPQPQAAPPRAGGIAAGGIAGTVGSVVAGVGVRALISSLFGRRW